MKIAIIGSGISGLGAAWLLNAKHEITVYEKDARIGGHSNTVEASGIPVDTGFIVYNARNYPHLVGLFKTLGVAVEESNMSFGVSLDGGKLEYAGTSLNTVFAQRKNLVNPRFLNMLKDIVRFNKQAAALLKTDRELTLGAYLDELKMGEWFRYRYLLPMAGAIWSCPLETMLAYPAQSFLRFFENHGLLTVADQPQWYTVKGGSREYVRKLSAPFADRIRLNTAAHCIIREVDGVMVEDARGEKEFYDHVVMAAHADQILPMLKDADGNEKRVLSAFRYQPNRAVLHRDASLMPQSRRVWSSWNYLASGDLKNQPQVSLTYWMNRLQNIDEANPLFVTLNPPREPDKILYECQYAHPVFDQGTRAAQMQLPKIQGQRRTWFCGAWTRYGFHEDGLMSAVGVANALGVTAPWQ